MLEFAPTFIAEHMAITHEGLLCASQNYGISSRSIRLYDRPTVILAFHLRFSVVRVLRQWCPLSSVIHNHI